MYQRLLFLLSVLFISMAGISQDVMTPSDGDYIYDKNAAADNALRTNPTPITGAVMQKWVHDPTQIGAIGSFQLKFKSYRIGNVSFRLRFPNGYNPANKYPAMMFLHGAGEAANGTLTANANGADRENQYQLLHGASIFSQAIDDNLWNGFMIFPQLVQIGGAGAEWDNTTIPALNPILDRLAQYNGLDVDRVTVMGLSAGGLGSLNYADFFPMRIASAIPSCPERIQQLTVDTARFLQIPLWIAAGGEDTGPDPGNILAFRDGFSGKGGNEYLYIYPTQGHGVWYTQWASVDVYNKLILYQRLMAAHKAQPLVYNQKTQFCTVSDPINAKMGLTAGFNNYEWQFDNGSGYTTVATGPTANIYTATQTGSYRARLQHSDGTWSAYTPNPVVISTKTCALDTVYAEHFDENPATFYSVFPGPGGSASSYSGGNVGCENGIFTNGTEVFSQDASGRQGGRFVLHNTKPTNGTACPYRAGDQVWRLNNPAIVTPNTDYVYSFYVGNQSTGIGTPAATPLAKLIPTINDGALAAAGTGVSAVQIGDFSWKKYSYIWNSGSNSTAQLALLNNTATGQGAGGNDFVLDEISLVKFKPVAMPGFAIRNVNMWAKANLLQGSDGSSVGLWTNNDINGNSLQQLDPSLQPLLNNNTGSSINFNPTVSYALATAKAMTVPAGFSGTASHSSVYAYVVAASTSVNTNSNLLTENQGGPNYRVGVQYTSTGALGWAVGFSASDTVKTPDNANELNKPILWSFSKSTTATGSGNKMDIRKNGVVIGVNNSPATTTFSGNGSDFIVGKNPANPDANARAGFDGNVAEIIYILDSNITALKQSQIESYLAIKYGTTLGSAANPISYVASDGLTNFWTGVSTYQNDVFGIGTDSLSGLVQAKSNSVNSGGGAGAGQFMKGNLVLATNTPLLNKQFLMIGNDNGALTETIIQTNQAAPVAVGSTRLSRNWKVANTGGVGAVDVTFDTTGLFHLAGGATVSNYALMIDDFGDGQYNHTIRFVTASGVSGKKLIFANAILNNTNVFTIVTMKSSLLPAVWLGFTAKEVNGNGLLNWKTGDEINVDRYVVEHSFNGISFSVIASVTANNSSGENNYTYTDNSLAAGVHYYRIRRVDKDGNSGYSDTQTLRITKSGANVQVRPNPVVGSVLQLAVSVQQNTKTSIQVMSVEGKLLLQQKATFTTGNNLVNLDVSLIPSGVYLVQVQLNDEVVTKKFVRQH